MTVPMDQTLVVAGILTDPRGRVLAARRSYPEPLAGRWEFPGGKASASETPQQALARELHEELGVEAVVGDELPGPDDRHWPINDALRMRAFWCTTDDTPTHTGDDHDQLDWVAPDALNALEWLPADIGLAAMVVEQLTSLRSR